MLVTVNDYDKAAVLKISRDLHRLGFTLMATPGTAAALRRVHLPVTEVTRAQVLQVIASGSVNLVINTPGHGSSYNDGMTIRQVVIERGIPLLTTLSAAQAALSGIKALREGQWRVRPLQPVG